MKKVLLVIALALILGLGILSKNPIVICDDDLSEEYMEAMTDMLITDKSWLGFQNSLEEAIGCDTDFFIEIIDNGIKIYELECVDDFDF